MLIFQYFQCFDLMYSEVAWVLVSSQTQVQPQIMLEPDHLPDYLSVSCNYDTESFIPPCRAGLPARAHMENFHLS